MSKGFATRSLSVKKMVLSNKKLKQQLRASVADSITESVSTSTKPPPAAAEASSLKELIDSATHKPRLSKREKRRINIPTTRRNAESSVSEKKLENGKKEVENAGKKKKRKDEAREGDGVKSNNKRKREDEVAKEDVEEGVKKRKKKKKKKKKGKGKVVKSEGDEEKKEIENGSGELRLPEAAIVANSQENVDSSTKVYVGGIPYYSTEDDIRSHFESCGTITDIFCMTFPDTGKFRGIAIISFKIEAAAKRALGFDETDMGGLLLKVKPYKVPGATKTTKERTPNFALKMLEGYNRVYVGNLSWDVTEEDLRNLFADCSISSIRFGTDKETAEFRGYAHVDFSDSLSLTMALKLDQELVCGRPAKISYAVPPKTAPKPVTVVPEPEPETTILQEEKTTTTTGAADPGATKKKIRRKCYLCGEKGHLSSSCPTAQNLDQKNA